jgi:hypothetical protein
MHHDLQSEAVLKSLKRKADKITLDAPGKMVKKNKHCRASKAKWTADEDEILTRAVVLNGEGNWKKIAGSLSDRSHLQCLHRWQKVLNPALVKGPWKEEEDNKLVELVEKYGPKDWSTIASHIQGRIGKQCRERWFNHLSPEVRKTNWSPEEDRIIIDAHHRLGNKWTAISKLLDGRPANAIKNHWNSTLLKRIQDNGGMPSVRRERKNSKTKSLSPYQPMNQLNTSTNSLSFSSEEDDLSEDEETDDVLDSSESSSPEQPESPEDASPINVQGAYPQQYLPLSQQQLLQELQFQQQLQQAAMFNQFGAENLWDWSMPAQQINVHTAGASMPIAMNGGFPVNIAGFISSDKLATPEMIEAYQNQNFASQPLQELQYCFDASQMQNMNVKLEDFSNVNVEASYGMNFLNMEMPGFLPLDI